MSNDNDDRCDNNDRQQHCYNCTSLIVITFIMIGLMIIVVLINDSNGSVSINKYSEINVSINSYSENTIDEDKRDDTQINRPDTHMK